MSKHNPKILLLEDDIRFRQALAEDFSDRGYEVTQADRREDIVDRHFDFAVLDLRLLGQSGLQSISEIKKSNPNCRIVILTGYGSVATTVEAMKLGAVNYLLKPVSIDVLEKALNDQLQDQGTQPDEFSIPSLNQHEHEYIDFVLTQNEGNISKTARQLGLHRQSLQRKLKKYP